MAAAYVDEAMPDHRVHITMEAPQAPFVPNHGSGVRV